jgi:hypothetical protein
MVGAEARSINSGPIRRALEVLTRKVTDLEANGGGSGGGGTATNEVFIGTDDPIAAYPTIELWYDTNAPGPDPSEQRWLSAWGAVGWTRLPGGATTLPNGVTNIGSVTYTHVPGRRYRLKLYFPALPPLGGVSLNITLDGTDITPTTGGPWIMSGGNYDNRDAQWDLSAKTDIAAGPHTIVVMASNNGAAASIYRDVLYVEDLGPLTGQMAVPPAIVTPWTAMPLASGWSNFAAGFQTAQYRKVGDIVYARGVVQAAAGAASTIATLPAGFRPPADLLLTTWFSTPSVNNAATRLRLSAGGTIQPDVQSAPFLHVSTDFAFSVSA